MQLKFNDLHYSVSTSWVASSPVLHYFFFYSHRGNRKSKVSIVIKLQAVRSGIQIMDRTTEFSVFHNVQTGSGAHAASSSMGTVILPWGYRAWDTHLHPGLRLRMSGATPLFPLLHMPSWFWQGQLTLYPAISSLLSFNLSQLPFVYLTSSLYVYSMYFMSPTC
jgi:hypothetical protein